MQPCSGARAGFSDQKHPRRSAYALDIGVCFVALFASAIAWAGDPCPIEFDFVDLGSPAWLAAQTPLAKLKRQEIWLGIDYAKENRRIVITGVHEGSPAARAAIQEDDIVLAVNGQEIYSKAEFGAKLDQLKPGDQVALSVKRGTATLELKANADTQDPLIYDLIRAAEKQECSAPSYRKSNLLADKRVEAAVFEKDRAFRCKDAHARLKQTNLFEKGAMVFVRGARRILISTVGWQTTCVDTADYDGEVPDKRIARLLGTISDRYVDDRFRHP